jgi:hypothetical protein
MDDLTYSKFGIDVIPDEPHAWQMESGQLVLLFLEQAPPSEDLTQINCLGVRMNINRGEASVVLYVKSK